MRGAEDRVRESEKKVRREGGTEMQKGERRGVLARDRLASMSRLSCLGQRLGLQGIVRDELSGSFRGDLELVEVGVAAGSGASGRDVRNTERKQQRDTHQN